MHSCVAISTQGDQVLFQVVTRMAAEFQLMDQPLHGAADLAAPAVALQHLPMQFAVAGRVESKLRRFERIFFARLSG